MPFFNVVFPEVKVTSVRFVKELEKEVKDLKQLDIDQEKTKAQKKAETKVMNSKFKSKELRDLKAGEERSESIAKATADSKKQSLQAKSNGKDDLTLLLATSLTRKRKSSSRASASSSKSKKVEDQKEKIKEKNRKDEDGEEEGGEEEEEEKEEEEEEDDEDEEEEERKKEGEGEGEGEEEGEGEGEGEGERDEEGEEEFGGSSPNRKKTSAEDSDEDSFTAAASQQKVLGALEALTPEAWIWVSSCLKDVLKTTGKRQSEADREGKLFLTGLLDSLRSLSIGKQNVRPHIVEDVIVDEEDVVQLKQLPFVLRGPLSFPLRVVGETDADSDDDIDEGKFEESSVDLKETRPSAARESIGSVFAVFFEQREEVNTIQFPMGPPRASLSEEEKCKAISCIPGDMQGPTIPVYSHHYQESILAKRGDWGGEGRRPDFSPVNPEAYPFDYLDDSSAVFAVHCYHAALGEQGCKSTLKRAQVAVTDSGWYSLFTGIGKESHKMNEVTAQERFDEFVRGRSHKYAYLLDKKQWHSVIHERQHFSLIVVFNTGSGWRPSSSDRCCVVSFDHLKYHDSAAHVNNICWFAFFPTDFFALLYSYIL